MGLSESIDGKRKHVVIEKISMKKGDIENDVV